MKLLEHLPPNPTAGLRRLRQVLFTFSLVFSIGSLRAEIPPAADAPQPLPPGESLKRFHLAPGFRIELVASEPHLADPVSMAFDARGRIFVCEIHGYNLDGHYDVMELNKTGVLDKTVRRIPANPQALERAERETYGTVKLLEDRDGDGVMDRATIWADHLPPCYGVVPARDGVIVLCAPDIVYLADRDGDGRAEVRETMFTGFGVGELWTRISSPHWGVDNWIYAASGVGSAGTIRGPHLAAPVVLGNTCFRFKPDGSRLEPISGGTSGFGLALTDFDDRFLVSNQQHALYVAPLPYHYLARNPYFAAPNPVIDISTYGHPAQVYPTAPPDPWRLKRSVEPEWVKFYGAAETTMGLVTAACAPLIYRADQFPAEFRGNHFSCESAYNLIHRCRLIPDGAGFKAVRTTENVEFLSSTEQWFRPVNLSLGPDGALYLVDMYREIIEDYTAIPRYLQQQYGLIAGHDRGRIWRVTHEAGARRSAVDLNQASNDELVSQLASANSWRRETAQRLLLERGENSVAPALAALLRSGPNAVSRLHALHTLAGLGLLDPPRVEESVRDPDPGVRLHALRLAEPWLDRRPTLLDQVLQMTEDPDPKVRLQVAFTLGQTRDRRREPALTALALRFGADRWMQAALLSSVAESGPRLFGEISKQSGPGENLARPLAAITGARQRGEEIGPLLEMIVRHGPDRGMAYQTNCLGGLVEGLRRGQPTALLAANGLISLRQLLASPGMAVRSLALQAAGLLRLTQTPEVLVVLDAARREATDLNRSLPERQTAIGLLASAPFEVLENTARKLLEARQPLDIQMATVAALAASDDPATGPALLAGWSWYSPKVQESVLDAMFRQQRRLSALLDAMESGRIPPQTLDALRREQLLANRETKIRQRARDLLAQRISDPGRPELLARYQVALSGPRDARRGQKLFQDQCVRCHSLQGVGGRIGPDLAGTKGRAEETLLLDILEPSAQITAGYRSYTIETERGDIFTGVVSAESATSVTIPGENGAEQTVLRKDITSMTASAVSLMPENLTDLVPPQDAADLLAYLREALGTPAKR